MTRRRQSHAARTIKEKAWAWALRFPEHAVIETADEAISKDDVRNALLTGVLRSRQTRTFRGTRYVLRGTGIDGRSLEIVCRLIPGNVRIVTTYRVQCGG